jgi:ATP-dependent DNA helicase RecG
MLSQDLKTIVDSVRNQDYDTQTIAAVSTADGLCDLHGLLSAFANQAEGGTILVGVDGAGVLYGVQGGVLDLQRAVTLQAAQMVPAIEPLFTVYDVDGVKVVAAEIPAVRAEQRPCYYGGLGVELGSFKRVGSSIEPLTPYEMYSFTADAQRIRNDRRQLPDLSHNALDPNEVARYLELLRAGHPGLQPLSDEDLMNLMGLSADGVPTLAALQLFGRYPQAALPQLAVVVTVPAEDGDAEAGVSKRVDGTIPQMVDKTMEILEASVQGEDGEEGELPVPATAVRWSILNALEHRDYSTYSETAPVTVTLYEDRVEVSNPGGLFGSTTLGQVGTTWCDVRNTTIAGALAVLGLTPGNQGGIADITRVMEAADCPAPEMICDLSSFTMVLRRCSAETRALDLGNATERLVAFCSEPRSRSEIAELFGLSSTAYVTNHYIMPAVEAGLLSMSLPDKPRSKHQRYLAVA